MGGFPVRNQEESGRPMLLLGASLLLIGILLFVAKSEGDGSGSFGDPGSGPGARPPSGNYQPGPMIPNTPITSQPGGSPINDSPDVTTVRDVRDTLNRLPLDRNNPKGWSNPKPTKRRNKG